MTPPLSPERLSRLLDDAVRPVTAPPGAFDRIRSGARRRRTKRRTGAVLIAAAVIAGGAATALVVTPGGGPARFGALSSSASAPSPGSVSSSGSGTSAGSGSPAGPVSSSAASAALPPGQTRTAALPSAGRQPVPSAVPSAARSAAPSARPSSAETAPSSSSGQPTLAPVGASAPPTPNRPAAGVPSETGAGTWAIDGPGQPAATVTIVPVGSARTTSSFLLVVRTAASGTQTVPFTATSVTDMPPFGPVVVGAADAAKDGHTELFVMADAGCCTEFWTMFRLVDGHIAQVSLTGAPVRLAVGGSVTDNAGFSCHGPYLVTYSYAYQPAGGTRMTFLATRDTYRWAGADLVLVSQRQATIRGERNPELARYSGVSCGALPQYEVKR